MNFSKKTVFRILAFILLFLGTVIFLIGTTSGLNLLFNLVNYFSLRLKIGQVTGNLYNLHLKSISYNRDDLMIKIDKLHLSLNLNCLVNGKFYVNNLSIKSMNIKVNSKKMLETEKTKEKRESNWLYSSITYPIVFKHMLLDNVNMKIDNNTISIMKFTSNIYWTKKELILKSTSFRELLIALQKKTKTSKERRTVLKIRNKKFIKKIFIEILRKFFPLSIQPITNSTYFLKNLNIQKFKGERLRLISLTNFSKKSQNTLIEINNIGGNAYFTTFNIDSNRKIINLTTVISNVQRYNDWLMNVELNGVLHANFLKNEKMHLKIDGIIRKKIEIDIKFFGPINVKLYTKAQLMEEEFPLLVKKISKKMFLSLSGESQCQLDNLKPKIKKETTQYILLFYTSISWNDTSPTAAISLYSNGNKQRIRLHNLITTTKGKTEVITLVNLEQKNLNKKISWYGKLKFDGIDTIKKTSEWTSEINGSIEANGNFYNKSWNLNVSKLKIAGNVNNNKISIEGFLKGNSHFQWIISSLHIIIGCNSADVNGSLNNKDIDLDVFIKAPNLSKILPGLSGTIKGLVKVYGTRDSPKILTKLNANRLIWKKLSIHNMYVHSDAQLNDQLIGNLNVRIEHVVQLNIMNFNSVMLNISGSEKKHDLQFRIKGKSTSIYLHLVGNFDRKKRHWNGQFDYASLNSLIKSMDILRSISILHHHNIKQKTDIKRQSLKGSCKNHHISTKINNITVTNQKMVNVISYFGSIKSKIESAIDTIQVKGIFTGSIDVSLNFKKSGLFNNSKISLSGYNVRINKVSNKISQPIVFKNLNLNINFKKNYIKLMWLILLDNKNQIKGQLQVINSKGQQNVVSSIIDIHNFNLIAIDKIYFHERRKISGIINANLCYIENISNQRQIFGQIRMNNINIRGSFVPFNMKPSQFLIKFNGTYLTLVGAIHTQQEEIKINGNANWGQIKNWRAHIIVKCGRVRITVPPMVKFEVLSNIILEITPKLITMNSCITIPWARIVMNEFPKSIINVSDDEVIFDEHLKDFEPKNTEIVMNNDLIIHIGNDVRLNAFGLNTKLTGDLKITHDQKGLILNGQILLSEGQFHAYGQDLLICKGELIFSGSPDQPFINIEAIRNPETTKDNVIAGVRIIGMANEPKVEVFSNSLLISQQETLSYLLRGQGIRNNESESISIVSMLIKLGISQSNQVVNKIGERLGISSLSLDTQGNEKSSRIVLSGCISPDLRIKYAVGIFDSFTMLTLRYQLMSKLYLEAVSAGTNQTIDLLYQFKL